MRKARGNRCLTSADGINSRAAERGSPAANSQEREREGASGGQRRAKSTGPRQGRPTPKTVDVRGLWAKGKACTPGVWQMWVPGLMMWNPQRL